MVGVDSNHSSLAVGMELAVRRWINRPVGLFGEFAGTPDPDDSCLGPAAVDQWSGPDRAS